MCHECLKNKNLLSLVSEKYMKITQDYAIKVIKVIWISSSTFVCSEAVCVCIKAAPINIHPTALVINNAYNAICLRLFKTWISVSVLDWGRKAERMSQQSALYFNSSSIYWWGSWAHNKKLQYEKKNKTLTSCLWSVWRWMVWQDTQNWHFLFLCKRRPSAVRQL